MAKANGAKRCTLEAAVAPIKEDGQDHVDTAKAAETGQEVRSAPSAALQQEARDLGAVEQTTREKCAEARKPGWRHIGRIPSPALTESDPSSRRPLQLPTEVCERIIDWQWNDTPRLQTCALVCKAWTPRSRYWMQRNLALYDRSHVQGHARRSRTQPDLLQQARTVRVVGGAKKGERAPVPQLGTLAIMGAGKLPLVWRLVIGRAIWKPGDFHPLIFFYFSAFSSVTTLRLHHVTFPKVREFGRLVCALPSLVRLRCENVLFTSTAPCASLAITRCPPSVRLSDLVICSDNETSSSVEANKVLIGHLCAAGVVTGLQSFEFNAEASFASRHLGAYKKPLHELFKQCSRSLRSLKLSPNSCLGNVQISDAIIGYVFDLAQCNLLETVVLKALNCEKVGYAWMRRILESNVSKELREVSVVIDRPVYSLDAEENLQRTVSALRKDLCPQLNELFSNKDYEKLHYVNFVFWTHPDRAMPDATRWASLLKAEMPKLDEQGILWTRVDVLLELWNENYT